MGVKDWLKKKAEGFLDRTYEGPELPDRFLADLTSWANANPRATRIEWLDMCLATARSAYRAGYIQGFERELRDESAQEWREHPPEVTADAIDPSWRTTRHEQLIDPHLPPSEIPLSTEALSDDFIKRIAQEPLEDDDDDRE